MMTSEIPSSLCSLLDPSAVSHPAASLLKSAVSEVEAVVKASREMMAWCLWATPPLSVLGKKLVSKKLLKQPKPTFILPLA